MKFNMSKAWVTWAQIGFGVTIFALFEPQCVSPLGFVWGCGTKGKKLCFDVHGSFVKPWARRQGVRRRINEEIFKQFDVIRSQHGTREGSAFMRASGYKFSAAADIWYAERTRKKP